MPSEHDDSMKQSFTELEKDAQACRLLIRRLRVGQASEEAVKDLTSLKVSSRCRVENRHAWHARPARAHGSTVPPSQSPCMRHSADRP